jgi:hypothetical protein
MIMKNAVDQVYACAHSRIRIQRSTNPRRRLETDIPPRGMSPAFRKAVKRWAEPQPASCSHFYFFAALTAAHRLRCASAIALRAAALTLRFRCGAVVAVIPSAGGASMARSSASRLFILLFCSSKPRIAAVTTSSLNRPNIAAIHIPRVRVQFVDGRDSCRAIKVRRGCSQDGPNSE